MRSVSVEALDGVLQCSREFVIELQAFRLALQGLEFGAQLLRQLFDSIAAHRGRVVESFCRYRHGACYEVSGALIVDQEGDEVREFLFALTPDEMGLCTFLIDIFLVHHPAAGAVDKDYTVAGNREDVVLIDRVVERALEGQLLPPAAVTD